MERNVLLQATHLYNLYYRTQTNSTLRKSSYMTRQQQSTKQLVKILEDGAIEGRITVFIRYNFKLTETARCTLLNETIQYLFLSIPIKSY